MEDVSAFQTRYGSDLPLAGAWSGRLGNGGETITLLAGEQLLQQFAYDDGWYPPTDGQGKSLEIVDLRADDPSRWQQASAWRPSSRDGGSPGVVEHAAVPGDANRDGQFDSTDLLLVFTSGEYEDLRPGNSTWEEGDWDGDGDFTTADMILAFQNGGYAA